MRLESDVNITDREQRWRGGERTEATVRRAARRLRAQDLQSSKGFHTASAVTRTSTVASVRGGWAARGERCAAHSARVVAALHEGAIRAAPMAESGV